MTFTNPFAWGLLLLAIPIILFFFLKVRFRQEPVTTNIFWQQVFEEHRIRTLHRRFRYFTSLLFALLFLTFLTAAALDPVISSGKNKRCVLILDNSASMNAVLTQSKTTRFSKAKQQLQQTLAKLGRQTAILTTGGTPVIASGFTDHVGTLRRKLGEIPATDLPTNLTAAVNLAERLIADQPDSPILIFTDGESAEIETIRSKPNIRFVQIGTPTDNLAITRFQPRRLPENTTDYEILIETINYGAESVQTRIQIEQEGEIVDVIPLTLPPNIPVTKIIRGTAADGGLLRASLEQTDVFPVDNTAVAFLSERLVQQIFLYGKENFFLLHVLQSQPQSKVSVITEIPNPIPPESVFVFHQTVPAIIPQGNVLIVDPQNDCDLFRIGNRLEKPMIVNVDSESALTNLVKFSGLIFSGAKKITAKKGDFKLLAGTADDSLIYGLFESGQQRVLVLTADLNQGDFTLRTAFPILMTQALAFFRGDDDWQKAYSTSETVKLTLPADLSRVVLRSPSGKERVLPCQKGLVSFGDLSEVGVWSVCEPESGEELAKIACNLFNAAESDLRSAAKLPELGDDIALGSTSIWHWFAIAALLLTLTEWFLYQRRWVE